MMLAIKNRGQIVAAGLRGATLASRFGLMFYLATELSLSDMGLFGLYWAGVQLGASLIPLDVYAQTTRLLLSEKSNPSDLVGRHFGFILLAIVLLVPVATYLNMTVGPELQGLLLLIFLFHLPLEVVSTEIGRLLVPLGKPLMSNVILFIRSALWFFPLVFLFAFDVIGSSLSNVALTWFLGSFLSVLVGFKAIRGCLQAKPKLVVDIEWVGKVIAGSIVFLMATLLFRTLLGVDRYIVDAFFGEEGVGVYTIYASVSLGVLGLIESGVSAWHYPGLIVAVKANRRVEVIDLLRKFFWQNFFAASFLMIVLSVLFPLTVSLFLGEEYYRDINTFYAIACGVLFYCISMPFHYVVYAHGKDWNLVAIYAISMLCMVFWAIFFMEDLGILGAGMMLACSLVVIAFLRFFFSMRILRSKVN